jgi:hypothetical protein
VNAGLGPKVPFAYVLGEQAMEFQDGPGNAEMVAAYGVIALWSGAIGFLLGWAF